MEEINALFLSILKSALCGRQEQPRLTPQQWQQLFDMAGIHKVLPLFFETVCGCPSLRELDASYLQNIKRQVMQQVTMQNLRTEEFLALNRSFRAAGITPLVFKGILCRALYPLPDHRLSADEDLLIPPEQFAAAQQVLLDFGMHVAAETEPSADAYEVPYRMAGSPLYIELHKQLFSPDSQAYGDLGRFFADVFARAETVSVAGQPVLAMEPTDHLFYMICHAFKHFLHSGFGIRQICDIILYANLYGSRIRWDAVLESCRSIRAEKFAAAMLRIGSNYLVFDPEQACCPAAWQQIPVDELPMLEDLLSGGVYGSASLSRLHSSSITLDAVAAERRGKKRRSGFLVSAFPPASQLKERYPYLQKTALLLPVAWTQRLWQYLRETRRTKDNSAADALKLGQQRISLLKEYGIID
jgi:hypothetical protein